MTLGGLALAVGILVDDATVEIENIHRNLGLGKPLRQAILDGAMQIAGPTFVSTLTISIVFVSVLFLDGPPKYLFTPLALAVVFAMLASYLLSRTLVPVMVDYLLPAEIAAHGHGARQPGFFGRLHAGVRARLRAVPRCLRRRCWPGTCSIAGPCSSLFGVVVAERARRCCRSSARTSSRRVDAGQFRLHVRAPAGTRLEETERYFSAGREARSARSFPQTKSS